MQEYYSFIARIATYALIEKYPLNTETFTYNYINRFGYDQLTNIIIFYFIEKKDYQSALNLIDFINNYFFLTNHSIKLDFDVISAFVYTLSGNVDEAIKILSKLQEEPTMKETALRQELQMLYIAGIDKTDPERFNKIKNELIIAYKSPEPITYFSYESNITNGVIESNYKIDEFEPEIIPNEDIEKNIKPKELPPEMHIFDYKYHIIVAYMRDYSYFLN